MVVVVQLLAADDRGEGREVGRRVVGLEVPVAPEVAEPVDDAGGEHRNAEHLHGEDGDAGEPEQRELGHGERGDARDAEARVDVALHPVVGGAVPELVEHRGVGRRLAVELRPLEQHLADAVDLRAVRVLGTFAAGVMLAVHRHPLLRDHARGEPQPEAEEVLQEGVQVDGAVRLAAVQVDGDRQQRDVTAERGPGDQGPHRHVPGSEKKRHEYLAMALSDGERRTIPEAGAGRWMRCSILRPPLGGPPPRPPRRSPLR